MLKFRVVQGLLCLMFSSCAGFSRGCSSKVATAFGWDWLVAQYRLDGEVLRCWKLVGISIGAEEHGDGIVWKSPDGHLIHIAGWYNRVQVDHGDWAGAAASIGVDIKKCSP